MSEKPNAFICGTVRNCERWLDHVFNTIRQLETLFNKIHIIVSYDDSSDKSLLKLAKFKALYTNRMDIFVNREPMSIRRTENIANARNKLLDKMNSIITEKGKDEKWPYFIMMDMDDVCANTPNLDVVQRALNRNAEWDSISFNRPGYYDIWALSISPFIYSCWGWEDPQNVVNITREYIVKKLETLPPEDLLECKSAFNGFAIYKTDPFLKCRYDWLMPKEYMTTRELKANRRALNDRNPFSPLDQLTEEPDCEHRAFHMSAIHNYGARVMISPECVFT